MGWLVLLTVLAASSPATDLHLPTGMQGASDIHACVGQEVRDTPSMTNARRERELLVKRTQIYARSGDVEMYNQTIAQIKAKDAEILRIMTAQAVIDIDIRSDACRAQKILSHYANDQIFIRAGRDGNFSLFARGRDGNAVGIPGSENLSRSALIERIQRTAREALAATGL